MSHRTFEKLVKDDPVKVDYVGMVAYTLYKREKLNWIAQFKARNNNVAPTIQQIHAGFNIDTDSDLKVKNYRDAALVIVNQFMVQTIEEELDDYKNDVRNDAIVKAVKKGFWTSVGENVFAGLIGAAVIALFTILVWFWQVKDNPAFRQQAGQQIQNQMR